MGDPSKPTEPAPLKAGEMVRLRHDWPGMEVLNVTNKMAVVRSLDGVGIRIDNLPTAILERIPDNAPPFQRGDVVRLKSGGPLMTVSGIDGHRVQTLWPDPHAKAGYGTGTTLKDTFSADLLIKMPSFPAIPDAPPLKPNDRVMLFCGGPVMTVMSYNEGDRDCYCAWCDSAGHFAQGNWKIQYLLKLVPVTG